MIELKINITPTELTEFGAVVQVLRKNCFEVLTAEQYFHFYNIQNLLKKCFDKQYNSFGNVKKQVTLKVNINEFETAKYLYELLFQDFSGQALIYYRVLMQKILSDLDKKQKQLEIISFLQPS